MELRRLTARVVALEAGRPRRKRAPAPRPGGTTIGAREKLWAKYVLLEMQHGHGRCRLTKLAFCMKHRLNPSEFARWFSTRDRRGVPEGSTPDRRFRHALDGAIAELESAHVRQLSQRNSTVSQYSGMRPQ